MLGFYQRKRCFIIKNFLMFKNEKFLLKIATLRQILQFLLYKMLPPISLKWVSTWPGSCSFKTAAIRNCNYFPLSRHDYIETIQSTCQHQGLSKAIESAWCTRLSNSSCIFWGNIDQKIAYCQLSKKWNFTSFFNTLVWPWSSRNGANCNGSQEIADRVRKTACQARTGWQCQKRLVSIVVAKM